MANATPTVLMLYPVLREEAPSLTCWNNLSVFSFPRISEVYSHQTPVPQHAVSSILAPVTFEHPYSSHLIQVYHLAQVLLSAHPPLHRHPISCSKPPSAVLAQYQPQLQNIFCQVKELGSPLTKHKLQEGRCHVFITSVIPISCCLEPSMQ